MLQESLTLSINRKLRFQYLWNLSTGIVVWCSGHRNMSF